MRFILIYLWKSNQQRCQGVPRRKPDNLESTSDRTKEMALLIPLTPLPSRIKSRVEDFSLQVQSDLEQTRKASKTKNTATLQQHGLAKNELLEVAHSFW